jgi:aminoglycoside phosphotransferase (APT) family kinase protein
MEMRTLKKRRRFLRKTLALPLYSWKEPIEENRKTVEYTIIQRDAHAFQQPVSAEHIQAMCQRAFGPGVLIRSVIELGSGQFNNTYLLDLAGRDPVVLRVAPSPERAVFWHERFLMRRELAMQPLLAPIAPLLPTILMSDCSHQILDRDYLFQRWISGTLWWNVEAELAAEEHDELWRQFGHLVHTIASVQAESFGLVQCGPRYPFWSLTIVDWLARSIADAEYMCVESAALRRLLELACEHIAILDEITCPRLLHGDLWLFNLLIERTVEGPRIVGVLDADRGSWGDPLADWTFFLLERRATPQEQSLFWKGYGERPDTGQGARLRSLFYQGLHHGKILSVASRDGNKRAVHKASQALAEVVYTFQHI